MHCGIPNTCIDFGALNRILRAEGDHASTLKYGVIIVSCLDERAMTEICL